MVVADCLGKVGIDMVPGDLGSPGSKDPGAERRIMQGSRHNVFFRQAEYRTLARMRSRVLLYQQEPGAKKTLFRFFGNPVWTQCYLFGSVISLTVPVIRAGLLLASRSITFPRTDTHFQLPSAQDSLISDSKR